MPVTTPTCHAAGGRAHPGPPRAAPAPRTPSGSPAAAARRSRSRRCGGCSSPCLSSEALAEPQTRAPARTLGSRRGRGAADESDAKPERAAPAAVVRDRPCRPRNPVLRPDGRLSGKKLRRLFFRKPHYSIMFMCSVSTLYYLQHEILVH